MLGNKAKPRRLNSKGNLNGNNSNTLLSLSPRSLRLDTIASRFGRALSNSIPVLSIFALVGILAFSVNMQNHSLTCSAAGDVCPADLPQPTTPCEQEGYIWQQQTNHCWECVPDPNYIVPPSASLTIGGAGETEQVAAGRGNTIYRTHTITLNADNIESYALTIAGNPNMTNPDGSNTMDTITSTNGNIIGSNLVDNTWGYYYGEYNSTNGNSKETVVYQPLASTGTTIDSGNPSNHTITNQTKNLVFAAKFGEDIILGRYYANVDLSMIATPRTITYTLSYNANGGTGAVPTTQTITTTSDSYEFTVANQGGLTKTGYSFLGWSESSVATSAQYVAGSKITLSSTTPSRVLYAVWEKQILTIKDITKMQEMYTGDDNGVSEVCRNSRVGDTNMLVDSRDNATYTVIKHSDDNCWMTQNLRIVNKAISYDDSDMPSGNFDIPASNLNGFSKQDVAYAYYGDNQDNGAYYSWYTATAGRGTSTVISGDVDASICPKGWKMPRGNVGTDNDFARALGYDGNVVVDVSVWGSLASPVFTGGFLTVNGLKWIAAGRCHGGTNTYTGERGYFWSRTASNASYAYRFDFRSGNQARPASNSDKFYGYPIRCVAYSN